MAQPALSSSAPELRHEDLARWIAGEARKLPGLTEIMIAPGSLEVIFTGPARTRELALACQGILTEAQRRFAPGGTPTILGGFQNRGLEALDGYLRLPLP